jgi:tRNA A-37 threonylcarbamoyl transferase component Bud32
VIAGRAASGRRSSTQGVSRVAFGLLVIVYSITVFSVLWRLGETYAHRRPDLVVDEALVVEGSALTKAAGIELGAAAGSSRSLRVVEVDGSPVAGREDYLNRFSGQPCAELTLEAVSSEGAGSRLQLTWIEVSRLGQLTVDDHLGLDPGLDCFRAGPAERVREVDGQGISSPALFRASLGGWKSADLSIVLESRAARRVVWVRVIDWSASWAIFLAGALIGATGLVVFWLRPRGRSAWGLLIFALVAGLFWCVRSLPHSYRLFPEQIGFLLLLCALPGAAALLLVTFGPLRNVVHRVGRVAAVGALFGSMLLAVDLVVAPAEAAVGALARPLLLIWASSLLALLLVATTADQLLRARGYSLAATDVSRARILRWAMALAFGPITLYTWLLPRLLMGGAFADLRPWVELSVVAFPALLGYAIVRHDALQMNELAVLRGLERGSSDQRAVAVTLGVEILLELPPAQRCRGIVLRIEQLLSARRVTLWYRSPGADWKLVEEAPAGRRPPEAAACAPLLAEAGAGRMVFLDDVLERVLIPNREALRDAFRELDAVAVFPLRDATRVLGVLSVGGRRDARNYTSGELRQIRDLARQAAHCLGEASEETLVSSASRRWRARPRRLASYDIDRVIGSGATSVVYLASRAGRQVAIKVPLPAVRADEKLLERFLRESRALSLLDDPHVLPIYEVGWADQDPFVAMEYCSEGTLRDLVRGRGRLSEAESLSIAAQVASGLESGLRQGIIHRDVKPANVFKSDDGRFKVGDFGLARFVDETTVTGESSFLGTAAYVAPEVARGDRGSWLADQYSLGICLFEMLVGERPFLASHPAQALAQHLYQPLPDLRSRLPELSSEAVSILERMTAKDPASRFQTWSDVIHAIGGGDG